MDGTLPTQRVLAAALLALAAGLAGCTGSVGTTAASFLRRVREDPDPNVRFLAYSKLASPNCYDSEDQKTEAAKVLVARLEKGGEPIATRAVICRTLGELRAREARPALLRAIEDPEGVVRVEACRALGKVGAPEDATTLTRIMTLDNLLDCRVAAIDGLGELKPDDLRILQVLVEGMDNDLPAVRLSCLDALRKITGKNFGTDPKPWREYVEARARSKSAPATAAKPGAASPSSNAPVTPSTTQPPQSSQVAQPAPARRLPLTPWGN